MRTVTGPGAIPQGRAPVAHSPLAGVHLYCTLAGHNRQLRCLQPRPSSMLAMGQATIEAQHIKQ
eukprot:1197732-Amphidinium_carterae.1